MISELINMINSINDKEDLRILNNTIINRVSFLESQRTLLFKKGQKVEFTDRLGKKITGTIAKINKKTIKVTTDDNAGHWKVSPSMLTLV